jgi:hypothetical protein
VQKSKVTWLLIAGMSCTCLEERGMLHIFDVIYLSSKLYLIFKIFGSLVADDCKIRHKLREEAFSCSQTWANITQIVATFCQVAFYFTEPSPSHFGCV